jgi:hypothetical protein
MEGRSADDPAKSTSTAAKTAQSPDRILDIGCAFCKSKVLLSAVELGLFTELGGDPLDLATLTKRLGLHERGARDFFDALVALKLLERDAKGRYFNRTGTWSSRSWTASATQ